MSNETTQTETTGTPAAAPNVVNAAGPVAPGSTTPAGNDSPTEKRDDVKAMEAKMKELLAELKDAKLAKKKLEEIEKAAADKDKSEAQKREEAEKKYLEAIEKAKQAMLKADLLKNGVDPVLIDDAVRLIHGPDLYDGDNLDQEKIKAAIDKRPFLRKTEAAPGTTGGIPNQTTTTQANPLDKSIVELYKDKAFMAQNFGKLY